MLSMRNLGGVELVRGCGAFTDELIVGDLLGYDSNIATKAFA